VLNMMLMAMAGIPRGVGDRGSRWRQLHGARVGDRAKVPEPLAQVLDGSMELTTLDARLVQPYYAKQLAARLPQPQHDDGRRRRAGEGRSQFRQAMKSTGVIWPWSSPPEQHVAMGVSKRTPSTPEILHHIQAA